MQTLDQIVISRLSSEVALKNKRAKLEFIAALLENLKTSFKKQKLECEIHFQMNQLYIHCNDKEGVCQVLKRTFGVGTYSPVDTICPSTIEDVTKAGQIYQERVTDKEYAIRCKKTGGQFNFRSHELERSLGSSLRPFAKKVNLDHPEVTVFVELHNNNAYLFSKRIKGPGGMPNGSQGRALCLISGGFDSAVAAWRILKRGPKVDFIFYNLSGQANERLVLQIVKVLTELWGCHYQPKFYSLDFKGISKEIKSKVKGSCQQIVLKRFMYRVADHFCKKHKYDAFITGEAIAQVSSQTLANLNAITKASDTQVVRPLIGFDKEEIIDQARMIGTAQLSEKVQEHCGISHSYPMTRGLIGVIKNEESLMDFSVMDEAIANTRDIDIDALTAKDFRTQYLFTDKLPPSSVIIDCQQPHMRRAWHIPNSVHFQIDDLLKNFKQLDKSKSYVLYCTYGSQTPYVAEVLQQFGYDAYAFQGGINQVKSFYETHFS